MFALDEIQYYPVNWTDGMRVSAKDFVTTDRAWADALRDVRASLFQGVQFGLLPPLRDSSDTSSYPKLVYDTSRSLLTLQECRGITEGGYRIEITEDLHRSLQIPLHYPKVEIQQQESFSVYITIEMFQLQGAGKMSADAPPRHQVVTPFYELSLIYKSDEIGLSGFNHLKIAEYIYSKGNLTRNEHFIPPCMTINAHNTLLERFNKAGANLKLIHDNGIKLAQLYRTDGRSDVKDAAAWIEKIATYIAPTIWTYNDVLIRQSPLHTITFFKNLSQFILSMVDIHEGNRFLKANADSQRRVFKDLAEPNFNGDDLKTAYNRIDIALRALHLWFKALGESFKQGGPPIRVENLNK